jgi:hypothetical protein
MAAVHPESWLRALITTTTTTTTTTTNNNNNNGSKNKLRMFEKKIKSDVLYFYSKNNTNKKCNILPLIYLLLVYLTP